MHKWRLLALLVLQLLCTSTFAQGEANIWYFGSNAGLDFNPGSPVALTDGQMYAFEGCAVMSNANGELLFYTNGVTVWNRNHDTLSNGAGLLGGISSTQSSLIIPKPGNTNIFYIFTTSQTQQSGNWNFCYSEVDMTLDGGLGGITSNKNVFLYTPIGEKITAVKHANNTDIWVITRAKFTNAYLTYSVTSAGVNANPIIFNGGTLDNGTGEGYASPNWGYMKASPDGSKIAAVFTVVNRTDVLDFNKTTGQLSFRFTINQIVNPYGVEFSPNSSLLYISSFSTPIIRQYNLALTTPAEILSNAYSITNYDGTVPTSLQLAPDERIYTASGNYAGAINNPNQIGFACNFNPNAVAFTEGSATLGLPNFFSYFLIPSGIEHVGSCPNDSVFFSFLNGVQADSVRWNFDDPNSGVLNTSNALAPFHIYQYPGTYIVSVTTFQGSVITTVTKPVTIFPIPDISIGDDFTFCFGTTGAFYMSNTQNGFTYNWFVEYEQFPLTNLQHPFTSLAVVNTGIYYATATNVCGVSSDTAMATGVYPITNLTLGPDVIFCEGDQVYLSSPSSQGIGDYLWQDGSTEPYFFTSQSGSYSIQQSNICGSVSDTVLVTLLPLPEISLGTDTLFCDGETIQITPTGIFDDFVWQNGLINEPLIITETGTYIAYANAVCGTTYDTVIATKISTPVEINFADSLSFCQGTSLELDLTQANVEYLWQDGSEIPIYTITQAGEYHVTLSNSCGTVSDTTLVSENPLPSVSLGPDVSSCSGQPIILSATGTADNYLWQDGSTNSQFTITQSGEYYVSVSNVCGTISDTVLAVVNPLPSVFLGDDIFVCNESSVQLIANGVADTYLWSDGNTNSSITVTSPGTYSVTVTNSCGSKTDSIVVSTGSPTTGFININECEAVNINGITYSTSGEFTQVLQNAIGCDSILTINAEILNFNAQIFQQDSTLYFNGNPTSIQWINCSTGQAIPGATQTSFVPQTTGNYGAIITIGECVDSSNCRQIIQSSMPEKPSSLCDNLIVTPNPVNDQIEFTLDKSSYDIRLFTSSGALLISTKGNAQKQIINFQDLARAMYVLQVDECRFKIVKQ